MKTEIEKLKKQKEEIAKQIEELEKKEPNICWMKVPELGIEITKEQKINNKTYGEILKEVKEEEIADYDTLKKLRNISFESNWEKYPFMKDFWVFVPNPDKASKNNNSVASLDADSGRVSLNCDGYPSGKDSSLGVFLIKKMELKK